MPLPTTKPVQSSIRSFFTSSTPNYAPPPGQSPPPPAPPPPPPSTLKQQTQQQEKDQQEQDQQEQDQQAQKQLQEEHQRQEEQDQQQEQEQKHQQQEEQDQQQKHDQQPNIPLPSPPSKSTIPPSATIRIPTEADLPPFRRINALLLQVTYTESYYASTLHNPLARVITWSHDGQAPKVVGAVVCLIEDDDANANTNAHDPQSDETQRPQTLYLRSMCLLAPYRGLGLAQAALGDILEGVRHRNVNVVSITAHVWTENEDGLRWYKGRGFEKDSVKPLEGYYLRLRPGTAWLVRKTLPEDGAAQNGGLSGQRNGSGKGEGEEKGVVIPESVTAAVVNMPPPPPPAVHAAAAAATTTTTEASSAATTTPASGPPSTPTSGTRPTPMSGQSFQNQRPETEWNDLPEDMAPPRASALRGKAAGEAASGAAGPGSRGASAGGKKKRDRSYPAAAFGSQN